MANEKRRLIDANALKKCTCEWCNTHYSDEPCEPSECIEMLRIDAQPTVDAVPVVHGRWIDDGGLDEDGNGQYRCSSCGVGEKHNPTVTVSYCWNCGAKMDGDGNAER